MSDFFDLIRSKDWISDDEHLEMVDVGMYEEEVLHWFTDDFITSQQIKEAIDDPDVYVGVIENARDVGFVVNLCEPIPREEFEEGIEIFEGNPQADAFLS